jgi:hypothetical protein
VAETKQQQQRSGRDENKDAGGEERRRRDTRKIKRQRHKVVMTDANNKLILVGRPLQWDGMH